MKVLVNNKQRAVQLPKGLTAKLKKVLMTAGALYDLVENTEVSLSYVTNAQIRDLNAEYRQIDRATDVLSFAMFEGEEIVATNDQPVLLGDIIISVEKAKEQAQEYNHSLDREMAYLAVHGFLHLIGYDHMTDEEKSEMRENEEYILEKLGLTRDSD